MQNSIQTKTGTLLKQAFLAEPENQNLIEALGRFSILLERYGFSIPVSSAASIEKLSQISTEKKQQIADYFVRWASWIEPKAEEPFQVTYDIDREMTFVTYALEYYGLHLDEEFTKTLENDHIIEVYGEDMIQMYRSLNFFKFCGYSLLDISINEWYTLWERPRLILEKMHQDVVTTLQNCVPCMKMHVPRHVNREIMKIENNTEMFTPSAYLVDFQYMGALKKHYYSEKPVAFICTSKAEILARGEDALSIQFV